MFLIIFIIFTKLLLCKTNILISREKIICIERKISFVLHEPDNESEGSSKSNVTIQGEDFQNLEREKNKRMQTAPGRPFLLRRGTSGNTATGSFKRRSLKLRRNTKEGKEIEVEACKCINKSYFLCI